MSMVRRVPVNPSEKVDLENFADRRQKTTQPGFKIVFLIMPIFLIS